MPKDDLAGDEVAAEDATRSLVLDAPIFSEPSVESTEIFQGSRGEAVRVIGLEAGFAILDLDGVTGYVRQDAVGDLRGLDRPARKRARDQLPTAARSGTLVSSGSTVGNRAPTLTPDEPAYIGAIIVANVINVFAWITLVAGQVIAIGAAAAYECSRVLADSCDATEERFFLYLYFAAASLFTAAFLWVAAYVLLLLNRIEQQTRER